MNAPERRPTLADLARRAGVSEATASRAIRGHPALSLATVQRVRAFAEQIGYRSNPLISTVMRQFRGGQGAGTHGNIGYLTFGSSATGWREHLTYLGFFEGVHARAEELGFAVDEIWADQPGMTPVRLREVLRARGITGVIIGATPGLPRAPTLDWSELAPVKIGVPFPDLPLPCVMPNQYHAMRHVIAKLQTYGYHRLGLVLTVQQHAKTAGMWHSPFIDHQQRTRREYRVPPLIMENWSEQTFSRWFKAHRPQAIIGLRRELVHWLKNLGCSVPDDVGFVHLDRQTETGNFAGMDQRPAEIGAAAFNLLLGRLLANERGLPDTQRLLLIDSTWVDGPTLTNPFTARSSTARRGAKKRRSR